MSARPVIFALYGINMLVWFFTKDHIFECAVLVNANVFAAAHLVVAAIQENKVKP